jgi:uncharacterized membrane protein YbhN (UPF0104 family)
LIRRLEKAAIAAGALVISALFGYLSVRDIRWASSWQALEHSNYWWLVPALAAMAASTLMRAVRWRVLFRPDLPRSRRSPKGAAAAGSSIGAAGESCPACHGITSARVHTACSAGM